MGTFWKILTENRVFSTRAPPSKLVYIGAQGAFRKFLGSMTKNGHLKIVQRGDPLGRKGVESLRIGGEASTLNRPSKFATAFKYLNASARTEFSTDFEIKYHDLKIKKNIMST